MIGRFVSSGAGWPAGDEEVDLRGPQGEHKSYQESVRLYQTSDIERMAEAAGLQLIEQWPSLLGPNHDAKRMVCWLQRNAQDVIE